MISNVAQIAHISSFFTSISFKLVGTLKLEGRCLKIVLRSVDQSIRQSADLEDTNDSSSAIPVYKSGPIRLISAIL
ncbi:unnamed protein product [Rhizophagus irregularis]|nr:unnamed protein product [Rhizophagus irregularis]